MDFALVLPWVSLVVGVIARIFVPWLAKRQAAPDSAKWAWKFVWPQLLSVVLIFLVLPIVVKDLLVVSTLPAQIAWLLGWGAASLGRQTYKTLAREDE